MTKQFPFAIAAFSSAVLALTVVVGCHHIAPSKPLSELTPTELAGHQVFGLYCSACHQANSTGGRYGPGLEGLFRRPYLKNGEAANDDRVSSIILYGRGMMPPFRGKMSSEQLKDLMAYLHTL